MDHCIFKGTAGGLNLILRAEAQFSDILKVAEEKFQKLKEMARGGRVEQILVRGRTLCAAEQAALLGLVIDALGGETQVEFCGPDVRIVGGDSGEKSVFYMGTVRSGSRLTSEADLVVIGDVNPGAEVFAVGNIAIYGSLRGIVHAGMRGNRDAVIAALSLNPTQIRIADIITRPPDGAENLGQEPEIAYIKDDNIYVENLQNHKK